MDLASVIIVTWNSEKFIEDCLASVLAQTYPRLEVIVVDNGSQDSTLRKIRDRYSSITIVENSENLGYCRANNIGLRRAQGAFILFLNSDVILEEDYIEKALGGFRKDERIGMVSGKILRFDRKTIDSTGQFMSRSRRTIERGYGCADSGQYDEEGYVFSVCGAVLFCRKTMVDAVSYDGGEFFDEDFFAFHEDIDAGWRAELLGWKSYYVPEARARHFRGGTGRRPAWKSGYQISGRPASIKYHIVKNRYLSIIKNDTVQAYMRDLIFIFSRDLLLLIYIVFTAPGVLLSLFRNRELFKKALERRIPKERRVSVL